MLQIIIPSVEYWDEINNRFITTKEQTIQLEHSLISIAKWEAKHKIVFLSKHTKKTNEQTLDYIRCMTITQNVDPIVYFNLSEENLRIIDEYITDPHTATTFSHDPKGGGNRDVLSAELLYYYMIAHNIPLEFQKWHLNRLITLIRVCSMKNESPKKRSRNELLSRNAALNAARRKQLNTQG